MTPLTARSLLVGTAVVVVGVGVVAPLDGFARVVLLAAGTCCAVLDVMLVRTVRAELRVGRDAGRATPGSAAGGTPGAAGVCAVDPDRRGRRTIVLGTAIGTGTGTAPATSTATGTSTAIAIGSGARGRPIEIGPHEHPHLVVVGAGVLAVAVFRAVAEQVRAGAAAVGADVRVGSAPELRPVVAVGEERCPDLPPGTAVLAVGPPARDRRAASGTTVVLVTGATQMPRRWDVAVEVGRHGCRVRHRDEDRGTPVSPPLPRLDT
ncbi:hypothetical protein ACRQ4B_12405 [Curtobacterium sp. SP.BCo]|uniref:hypothetical protein n=1 Tax=Curtobacterium sp. SP.BCo TaxID=3435229 RepID=UPI003F73B588